MLKKIEIDELVHRIENLPANQTLYLYGTQDITEGEVYGVMVTEAFETRMYLMCFLGYNHCKAISCNDSMRGQAERNAIKEMLQSCWHEAGLSSYFLKDEEEAATDDVIPVLTTLVRIREEGRHREVFTDIFVVTVPKSMGHYQYDEYIKKQLRAAAQALLTGESGDEAIKQSCRDFNWGDFSMWFEGNEALGIYLPGAVSYWMNKAESLDISVNQDEVLLEDDVDATLHIDRHDGNEPVSLPVLVCMRNGLVDWAEPNDRTDIAASDTLWLDFGNGVHHPVAHDQLEMEKDEERFTYFMYREDL
jgi:hypothetical protein